MVQHNRKHVGGINFSDEVASPTEPNHHKSVESEADKMGIVWKKKMEV